MLMFSLNHKKTHKTNKWQSRVCLSYLMLTVLRGDYCAHCAVDAETIYCAGNPTRSQQWAGPNSPTWCESVHGARFAQFAAKKWMKQNKSSRFHSTWWKFFPFINFCLTGASSRPLIVSSSRPLVLSSSLCWLQSCIIISSSFLRSTWQWCLVNTHPLLQYLHIVHV